MLLVMCEIAKDLTASLSAHADLLLLRDILHCVLTPCEFCKCSSMSIS